LIENQSLARTATASDEKVGLRIPEPDQLIQPLGALRRNRGNTLGLASSLERAEIHQAQLTRDGVPHSFRQELDGGSTLRFGPLPAIAVASALAAFVY
jgi:hypothetical protein